MKNIFECDNLKNIIHSGTRFFRLSCEDNGIQPTQDLIESVAISIAASFAFGANEACEVIDVECDKLHIPKPLSEEWNKAVADLVVKLRSENGPPAS